MPVGHLLGVGRFWTQLYVPRGWKFKFKKYTNLQHLQQFLLLFSALESEDDLTKQVDSLNTQLVAVKNALQTCQGRGSCENNLSKCQSSLSYSTKEM